jgi:pimeloyl-ACP methyl ester carboxylesterase
VTVADHRRDDSVAAAAHRILAEAPPRFALAGLSMGGYIAFEIMRQAPERVAKLALLDTSARADVPEQTAQRKLQIELAENGRYAEIADLLFPRLVHPDRTGDPALRALVRLMAEETGAHAFVRQQKAIIGRPDSRLDLATIACPTLVLVGEGDQVTPPERAAEIAEAIPGASLVTIAGSGHLSAIERPDAVTRALTQWLQG